MARRPRGFTAAWGALPAVAAALFGERVGNLLRIYTFRVGAVAHTTGAADSVIELPIGPVPTLRSPELGPRA